MDILEPMELIEQIIADKHDQVESTKSWEMYLYLVIVIRLICTVLMYWDHFEQSYESGILDHAQISYIAGLHLLAIVLIRLGYSRIAVMDTDIESELENCSNCLEEKPDSSFADIELSPSSAAAAAKRLQQTTSP